MTDLEMTRLCAKAMGIEYCAPGFFFTETNPPSYNPLHDDAQAMALVKRFQLSITPPIVHGDVADDNRWSIGVSVKGAGIRTRAQSTDLNRAIVECVAKMQAAL